MAEGDQEVDDDAEPEDGIKQRLELGGTNGQQRTGNKGHREPQGDRGNCQELQPLQGISDFRHGATSGDLRRTLGPFAARERASAGRRV